jgi:two-component system, LuxR family, sensor kinase FixL
MTMTTEVPDADPARLLTRAARKDGVKTVLIVDDQVDERAIQRAMLEHLGYRVVEAEDGVAALRLARSLAPDLVLLDIAMPHMDGWAVCEQLRSDPLTSATAVLFYTAAAPGEVMKRVQEVGGSGLLIKPVAPQEVANEVRKLIGPPPVS